MVIITMQGTIFHISDILMRIYCRKGIFSLSVNLRLKHEGNLILFVWACSKGRKFKVLKYKFLCSLRRFFAISAVNGFYFKDSLLIFSTASFQLTTLQSGLI